MASVASTELEPSQPHEDSAWAPPRWAAPTSVLLAVAGVGVSTYLTIAHFSSSTLLACPETAAINCEKVTTSPQSAILGVPVALIGLVFFAVMVIVNLPRTWTRATRTLRLVRLTLASGGVAFVLYLIYTELLTLHAICLWCTFAHALALSIFGVIVFSESLARPDLRASLPRTAR